MAVVRLPGLVVAVGRARTPLPALGRPDRLLHAARDGDAAGAAVARHLLGLRARVTRPRVAPAVSTVRTGTFLQGAVFVGYNRFGELQLLPHAIHPRQVLYSSRNLHKRVT